MKDPFKIFRSPKLRRLLAMVGAAGLIATPGSAAPSASSDPAATPSTADLEIARRLLDARVLAARALLERPPDPDARLPGLTAQWSNWNNWPNWPNWANWLNR
jgi:hypothetical protein